MDPSTTLAVSGPLLAAVAVAVLAGAVSFASPCVVPLVPGYLAYLAGLVGADAPPATLDEARAPRAGRWRVAGAAALFVAGFTAVFGAILVGVVWLADALVRNEAVLQRAGGVVMVAMGLAFVGLVPILQRERRVHWVPRAGLWGAPLLGAVFGLGLGAVRRADARGRRRRRRGHRRRLAARGRAHPRLLRRARPAVRR